MRKLHYPLGKIKNHSFKILGASSLTTVIYFFQCTRGIKQHADPGSQIDIYDDSNLGVEEFFFSTDNICREIFDVECLDT